MKIKDSKLIIDKPLDDSSTDELISVLKQDEITTIVIEEDDITAPVIQIIMCQKDKKIKPKTEFMKKVFANVTVAE